MPVILEKLRLGGFSFKAQVNSSWEFISKIKITRTKTDWPVALQVQSLEFRPQSPPKPKISFFYFYFFNFFFLLGDIYCTGRFIVTVPNRLYSVSIYGANILKLSASRLETRNHVWLFSFYSQSTIILAPSPRSLPASITQICILLVFPIPQATQTQSRDWNLFGLTHKSHHLSGLCLSNWHSFII
jgi:hypothetical protein